MNNSNLVNSAIFRPDIVEILPLGHPVDVTLSLRSVLENRREDGLVRSLLCDAHPDDGHVDSSVVFQHVTDHQGLLENRTGQYLFRIIGLSLFALSGRDNPENQHFQESLWEKSTLDWKNGFW